MIKYFLYPILLFTFYQLFTSCANVTQPTGGPRDTIPPIRLITFPEIKALTTKGIR